MNKNLDLLARDLAVATREVVEPLIRRIQALEARSVTAVRSGMIDRSGVLILTLSDGSTQELGVVVGRDGENGRDGTDGAPGKSVTADDVRPMLDEMVKALPPAKDGRDGMDADPEMIERLVEERVAKAVADLSPAKDGAPGRDGVDGKDGVPGEPGAPGKDGADGNDGRDADEATIAKLLADEVDRRRAWEQEAIAREVRAQVAEASIKEPDHAAIEEAVARLIEKARADILTGEEVKTFVSQSVAAAVAAIPPAQDGLDADMDEVRQFVSAEVERAVSGLPTPKDGAPGKDGQDGKDADVSELVPLIEQRVVEVVGSLPKPKDGEPGKDGAPGRDADPHEIARLLVPEVERAVAAMPKPKDGRDADMDVVLESVRGEVEKAVAALPPAPAGQDGKDGRDGADIKDLLVVEDGSLVATLSDGRSKVLGPFRGKDGEDGKNGEPGRDGQDGRDGMGFEDVDFVEREEGIFVRLVRGDAVKEARLPVPRDCGVFKVGRVYNKGDGVTFAGSFWIAQEDGVTEKPEGGKGWRLAVKRGRDRNDPVKTDA